MIKINKHTLSNGLRIVHTEIKSTQMVALNLLYDVGARDENEHHTGFAHLFEHLMFGGSKNVVSFDEPLQMAGGENNAWTSNDVTNFYITIPKQNVETAFWLESDRMLSLSFDTTSLETQRSVVIEEFKQRCLNQPYGDVYHLVRDLAFTQHPYKWPTIGKQVSHIEEATMAQVKDFFYRFYAPNNAVLAVTGNISFEEVLQLAQKWFGPIPKREIVSRQLPQEPLQRLKRTLEVERNVPVDLIYLGFHMCDRLHPDYYAYDMLSDILARGSSSRLIQRLIKEQQLFTGADANIWGSRDKGMIQMLGQLSPGVSMEQAEEALWHELSLLSRELVDTYEIEKVKNNFESTHVFEHMNYQSIAASLAFWELLGDVEGINTEVETYRKVTREQLQRIAKETFTPSKANLLYYKKKAN